MSYNSKESILLQWLKLYKSHRCLWDTTSVDYQNRKLRQEAYEDLLEKMQLFEPSADLETVKRKINNMRTGYRREYQRVKKYRLQGKIYKPPLYYYNLLNSFLGSDNENIDAEIDDTDSQNLDGEEEKSDDIFFSNLKTVLSKKPLENLDNNQFWLEWLNRYKSHSCLWDTTTLEYQNRQSRQEAYHDLLQMFQKLAPNADLKAVRKKINNMRTSYRRENNRVKKYKLKGRIYKPPLYYYNLLNSFLGDDEDCNDEADDTDSSNSDGIERKEKYDDTFFSKLKSSSIKDSLNNMDSSEHKQFWLEWLNRYKSYSCLWNTKLIEYQDKYKREKAYNDLLRILQTFAPKADIRFVKKKINNMRTGYRREHQRVKKFELEGKIYQPPLYYYDLLNSFLGVDNENNDVDGDDTRSPSFDLEEEENTFYGLYSSGEETLDEASEEEFWLQWLTRYKAHHCLWNITSDDYNNITKKYLAYKELLEMLQKIQPEASVENVKDKIKYFQSQYQEDFLKKEKSNRNGKTVERGYYYDLLDSFLNPITKNCDLNSYIDESEYENPVTEVEYALEVESKPNIQRINKKIVRNNIRNFSYKKHVKRKTKNQRECILLGRRFAAHFRKMNISQRLLAERLSTDICILGRMEKLKVDSYLYLK